MNSKSLTATGELLDDSLLLDLVRLQRDLEINLPGLALRIELLEERDRLRARVRLQERRS